MFAAFGDLAEWLSRWDGITPDCQERGTVSLSRCHENRGDPALSVERHRGLDRPLPVAGRRDEVLARNVHLAAVTANDLYAALRFKVGEIREEGGEISVAVPSIEAVEI